MSQWVCRECDGPANAVYKDYKGATWFIGWRCIDCGAYQKGILGPVKVK